MTIAVSSVVKPSKLLIASVVAMSAATAAAVSAAAMIWFGVPDFSSQAASVAVAGLAALLCRLHLARNQRTWRVDISGSGQIRLTALATADAGAPSNAHAANLVRLLEYSTIWTNLLVLRLRDEDGRIIVLAILRDSVNADDFRALSAALRWIALRGQTELVKIL